MATNPNKPKKSAKQTKQEQLVKNLKKEVINQIRLMPDEDFLEEFNSANFINDNEAMKKFRKEHHHEIQWILNRIDLESILKKV